MAMSNENGLTRKKVVILHGVGMHGFFMKPLAWRLRRLGYDPICLSYSTSNLDKEMLFSMIDNEIDGCDSVALVGHSFGGIMCAKYIEERCSSIHDVSHLVLLGCPINGSRLAQRATDLGLGWMLGDSYSNGLEPTSANLDISQPIYSIAGTVPFGFRNLLLMDLEPSDGTVSVAETRLDNLAEHQLVSATHSSMVYQSKTPDLIHDFLVGS